MSRTYPRNTRVLSDTENEEEEQNSASRRVLRKHVAAQVGAPRSHSTPFSLLSAPNGHSHNGSSARAGVLNNNHSSQNSSSADVQNNSRNVQGSWFSMMWQRFFGVIYLSTIRQHGFDIWLLSRSITTKLKMLMCILLPLLICYLYLIKDVWLDEVLKHVPHWDQSTVSSPLPIVLDDRFDLRIKNLERSVAMLLNAKDTAKNNQLDDQNAADIQNLEQQLVDFIQQFKALKDSHQEFTNHLLDIEKKTPDPVALQNEHLALTQVVHKCCDDLKGIDATIEDRLQALLKMIVLDEPSVSFFRHWLLSQQTSTSSSETPIQLPKDVGDLELRLKSFLRDQLRLYDADKNGMVDYALESGGGSVLGTRCSESYTERDGVFSVFGLGLWSKQHSPRLAIQPAMHPGECWAFKGSQGFLVVQLSYLIRPTGFTIDHIPAAISPAGDIDSAPRHFSVWGLVSETDTEGVLLGEYEYLKDGEPMQYFPIQNNNGESYPVVELKIHSNHGNAVYTCLYRFRVHGRRV